MSEISPPPEAPKTLEDALLATARGDPEENVYGAPVLVLKMVAVAVVLHESGAQVVHTFSGDDTYLWDMLGLMDAASVAIRRQLGGV